MRPFFQTLFLGTLLMAASGPASAEKTLVFLGDSLTAGLGLAEEQAFPALIQKDLPGWRVVNAGISGDTSKGGLKRLDWLLKAKPAAVFVCLGANDGLRGVAPSETEANLNAILQKLKKSGVTAYLAGMDLPSNLGSDYRQKFKAVFPRVAKKNGVPLLPFLLEGVGGHPDLNQADGVHPNEAGQRLVARHVSQFLLPRLKP
jgi:acyl-CoA thioesterase-1